MISYQYELKKRISAKHDVSLLLQSNVYNKSAIVAMHDLIVWSDAVTRPARFGPIRLMYYPDENPIGKARVIHRHTSYDYVVSTQDTGVKQDLPIDDKK